MKRAWRASLVILCAIVLSPLLHLDAHALGCIGVCQLTANTNVPTSDATVWILVDNTNHTMLPNTFSFLNGTAHTLQVLNQTLLGASSGARYVWKQWSLNNTGNLYTTSTTLTTPSMILNYTPGQGGIFIAEYQKQFKLALSFNDPSGQPIAPPESVTLRSGASTVIDSSYSGQWLDAKVWSVINATWEGKPNAELGVASFDLSTGSVTGILRLKAYQASIKVVDAKNNPLPNATVIVTFANATVRSLLSDSDGKVHLGHLPLGPYSVQVNYQGQNMGNWNANASANPVLTTVLDVGAQQPPQSSLLTALRTYWYFVVLGFVGGFAIMAGGLRLSRRNTKSAGEVAEPDNQLVRSQQSRAWPGSRSSSLTRHQHRPCLFSYP